MKRWHWFQFVLSAVGVLFFGTMVYVTYIAFTRSPGTMGTDMSKIQQKRQAFYQKTSERDIVNQ